MYNKSTTRQGETIVNRYTLKLKVWLYCWYLSSSTRCMPEGLSEEEGLFDKYPLIFSSVKCIWYSSLVSIDFLVVLPRRFSRIGLSILQWIWLRPVVLAVGIFVVLYAIIHFHHIIDVLAWWIRELLRKSFR